MPDNDQNRSRSDSHAKNVPTHHGRVVRPDPLTQFGGEQLEGSGFEAEIPEPDGEWRDPR